MLASIIIRTYNESTHLPALLESIGRQETNGLACEVILVDSGSTDQTVEIARRHDCNVVHIRKEDFSFGRSLNYGCQKANGDFLVFVSGHCVPVDTAWLGNLVKPLIDEKAACSYGRQVGNGDSRYSERQLLRKYFPETSQIPQEGYFFNNANAALVKREWQRYKFDEELTGLEDMALAKRLVEDNKKVAYVADAAVYHIHDETWSQVRHRYEREAIALRHIMPEVHIRIRDFIRFYLSAVMLDAGQAVVEKKFLKVIPEILMFRLMQFWGSYRGNQEHRRLSNQMKEKYFYPK